MCYTSCRHAGDEASIERKCDPECACCLTLIDSVGAAAVVGDFVYCCLRRRPAGQVRADIELDGAGEHRCDSD